MRAKKKKTDVPRSQRKAAAAAAAASASDEEDGDGDEDEDEDELVIVKKPRRDEAYGSDSDSSSCAPSPLLTAKRLEVFLPVVLEPVAAAAAAAEAAARVRAAAARARAAEEAAQARAAAEAEEVKKSTETTLEGLVGEAKAAFARTPASLVVAGRDKERAVIERFLEERVVQEQSGGALYISGCPGAGKTLLVSTLVQETVKSTPLRVAQVLFSFSKKKKKELADKIIIKKKDQLHVDEKRPHDLQPFAGRAWLLRR